MAELAERQEGSVSTAQLRALGLGRGAIESRLRRGWLHPVHRGVYAVGHRRLTLRGRYWAAVLACGGPGAAALSHRSAAAVWDLLPTPSGRIDVTTLRQSRSTAAINVHRSRSLVDVTTDDGLPLTAPTRTLIDLADVLTPHRLERAVDRAEILRLLDAEALAAALPRLPGRRTRALRAALARLAPPGPEMTRNDFEERFLALVVAAGLPRPSVNAMVCGFEADFVWQSERLVVETDGRATHLTATAFEEDRRRDAILLVAGYRVARFTWRRVIDEPVSVAATLRALLAGAGGG